MDLESRSIPERAVSQAERAVALLQTYSAELERLRAERSVSLAELAEVAPGMTLQDLGAIATLLGVRLVAVP